MTSQARIDANRRNAQKSTGPKTAEGKARARLNGLKHGLRSEEVVLPTESRTAFDAHMAAWVADWRPPTMARMHLVERAAVASWRLKRCVRVESEKLSRRVVRGLREWDEARDAEVGAAVRRLDLDTEAAFDRLVDTVEGHDALIGIWGELVEALEADGGWSEVARHHGLYFKLIAADPDPGIDEEEAIELRLDSWRLLLASRPDIAADDEERPLHGEAIAAARGRLAAAAEGIVRRLVDSRDDNPGDAAERARYAELKAFEPSPEDAAMLRYEGQYDREFRSTLNQLMKLTQTGADLVEGEEAPTEANDPPLEPPSEPGVPTEAKAEGPEAGEESGAPTEANGFGPDVPVAQADRDRGGRVWPVDGGSDGPGTIWPGPSDR